MLLIACPGRASELFGLLGETPHYDADDRNPFLKQIEDGKDFPTEPYQPPPEIANPYNTASLGPRVAHALLNGARFVDAADAQALAQSIVDRLIGYWGGPKPAVKVWITGEAAYGALAIPTGDIMVSLGTFNSDAASGGAASEDELALLLGHELGHILLRHFDRDRTINKLVGVTESAATSFTLIGSLSQPRMAGNSIETTPDQQMMETSVLGGLAATTLLSDVLAPSWGRSQELDADRIGLDLALRAGYIVGEDEIIAFITKHGDDQARRTARIDRSNALLKYFALGAAHKFASEAGPFSNTVLQGFLQIGNGFIDSLTTTLAGNNKDHPTVAERKNSLTSYAARCYPNSGKSSEGNIIVRSRKQLRLAESSSGFRDTFQKVTAAYHVLEQILDSAATDTAATAAGGLYKSTTPARFRLSPDLLSQVNDTASSAQQMNTVTPPHAGKKRKGTPQNSPPPPRLSSDKNFTTAKAPFTWEIRASLLILARRLDQANNTRASGSQFPKTPVDLVRNLGQTYFRASDATRLAQLVAFYSWQVGTDLPVIELAVASAVVRSDWATAEVRAAECYEYDDGARYPLCSAALGYDPTARGGRARTSEGQEAFERLRVRPLGKFVEHLGAIFQ